MLVADGVLPSNEGRGYVLRRIIRRAILAARRAGSERSLMASLVDATIEKMGSSYPTLAKDRDLIVEVLEREEAGFARTLKTGTHAPRRGATRGGGERRDGLSGGRRVQACTTPTAFPIELTEEIRLRVGAERRSRRLRRGDGRSSASARARTPSRCNVADDAQYKRPDRPPRHTEFVGRDVARYSVEQPWSGVLGGEDGDERGLPRLDALLRRVGGGQVGDTGTVVTETGRFDVTDTQNVAGGLFAHRGRLTGEIVPGQVAVATIDADSA